MPCALTKSVLVNCNDSYIGGIKDVLISELDSLETVSFAVDGTITGITMVTDKQFYKYQFVKNTASLVDTYAPSDSGGGAYTPVLTLNLKGLRQDVSNELQTLANIDSVAIVKDANAKYWAVGFTNGLSVTNVAAQTGANNTELNGYNALTLTGSEPTFIKAVDPSIIAALLVPAL
ncbi:MAG: hypothetical protein ACTHMM_21170 [Agriterribacter sp.]